jgi:hypothetical protein
VCGGGGGDGGGGCNDGGGGGGDGDGDGGSCGGARECDNVAGVSPFQYMIDCEEIGSSTK